jgi:hypothetical protein
MRWYFTALGVRAAFMIGVRTVTAGTARETAKPQEKVALVPVWREGGTLFDRGNARPSLGQNERL